MVLATPRVQRIWQHKHEHEHEHEPTEQEEKLYLGSTVEVPDHALEYLGTDSPELCNQISELGKTSEVLTTLPLMDSSEVDINVSYSAMKFFVPRKCRFIIVVLMISTLFDVQVLGGHPRACPVSIETLEVVSECPTNDKDWKKRAQLKACHKIQHDCSSPALFQYHCVLDETGAYLVEVCAPIHHIIGKLCAEFNSKGMVIQSRRSAPCGDFDKPCIFKYASNELYIYPECYTYVKSATKQDTSTTSAYKSTTQNTVHTDVKDKRDDNLESFEVYVATTALFGILLVVCVVTVCVYRKKNKHMNDGHSACKQIYEGTSSKGLLSNLESMQNHRLTKELLTYSKCATIIPIEEKSNCPKDANCSRYDKSVDSGFEDAEQTLLSQLYLTRNR